MRNFSTVLILLLLVTLYSGCEEFLLGAGVGVAGDETLQSWKANLEAKKAELAEQYAEVLKDIENAPDPNALALAKDKAEVIHNQKVANEAALLTVNSILDYRADLPKEDKKDFVASVVFGSLFIAYQALTKRKLNLKYTSMKEGQAVFQAEDPSAGEKLYNSIGIARRKRGL